MTETRSQRADTGKKNCPQKEPYTRSCPGMSSLATGMMKRKIEKANIPSLADLQKMAQIEGVALIACKMTVDMMEINEDKLI